MLFPPEPLGLGAGTTLTGYHTHKSKMGTAYSPNFCGMKMMEGTEKSLPHLLENPLGLSVHPLICMQVTFWYHIGPFRQEDRQSGLW